MICRRTWSQWIRMHWVICIAVNVSDNETRLFNFESTRWWLLAYCHMLYMEEKFKTKYSNCGITSWMDWKV